MGDEAGAGSRSEFNPALIGALMVGASVSLFAGAYGRYHHPASETTIKLFFSSTLHLKAWTTTVIILLVLFQLTSALWMYGKLPGGAAPGWVGPAHRMSGTLAFVLSLPVAYHCLWSLGFNPAPGDSRRLWHSIFGCAFYGAFAAKILVVRLKRLPGWALPVIGGVVFSTLIAIWLTSALWFFREFGIKV